MLDMVPPEEKRRRVYGKATNSIEGGRLVVSGQRGNYPDRLGRAADVTISGIVRGCATRVQLEICDTGQSRRPGSWLVQTGRTVDDGAKWVFGGKGGGCVAKKKKKEKKNSGKKIQMLGVRWERGGM